MLKHFQSAGGCGDETGDLKRVKVLGFEVQEGKITVNFGGGYYEMGAVREVLCRAAIVQSLVQIDGIESVAFEVEGNPLTDKEGQVVGSMRAEDFIKNTGSVLHSYEKNEPYTVFWK